MWLQDFAWTEKSIPEQLAKRAANADGEHERRILEQAPMFCVETAICLHRWAALAYMSAPLHSLKLGVPKQSCMQAAGLMSMRVAVRLGQSWLELL